jgi:hypothetical protein
MSTVLCVQGVFCDRGADVPALLTCSCVRLWLVLAYRSAISVAQKLAKTGQIWLP